MVVSLYVWWCLLVRIAGNRPERERARTGKTDRNESVTVSTSVRDFTFSDSFWKFEINTRHIQGCAFIISDLCSSVSMLDDALSEAETFPATSSFLAFPNRETYEPRKYMPINTHQDKQTFDQDRVPDDNTKTYYFSFESKPLKLHYFLSVGSREKGGRTKVCFGKIQESIYLDTQMNTLNRLLMHQKSDLGNLNREIKELTKVDKLNANMKNIELSNKTKQMNKNIKFIINEIVELKTELGASLELELTVDKLHANMKVDKLHAKMQIELSNRNFQMHQNIEFFTNEFEELKKIPSDELESQVSQVDKLNANMKNELSNRIEQINKNIDFTTKEITKLQDRRSDSYKLESQVDELNANMKIELSNRNEQVQRLVITWENLGTKQLRGAP